MLRTDKKNNSTGHRWEDEDVERKRTKPVRVHRKGADSKREKVSRTYKREIDRVKKE